MVDVEVFCVLFGIYIELTSIFLVIYLELKLITWSYMQLRFNTFKVIFVCLHISRYMIRTKLKTITLQSFGGNHNLTTQM